MTCKNCTVNCPVDATLKLIGGKYKSLILWHLVSGALRHGEIARLIPQATPKMLTQQLRELEADNLLTRTVFPVVPPKVEYALTEFGFSLKPILTAMYAWGEDYLKKNGISANCSMVKENQVKAAVTTNSSPSL
ncbi:MAG: helix-turn-helix transcriptional regulator [Erysipelotrichaceae bacterium]|jgi:DNA-binding HxlR family transcriptional regulator|nr:helix-turn-helix transcriptional regulator [Erysipelotrichaceae bacterium]